MTARATSISVYHELADNGELSRQEAIIFKALLAAVKPLTLREIKQATGIDINAVSGRVNGLKAKGFVVERATRRCSVTGRMVTPVAVADLNAQGELF